MSPRSHLLFAVVLGFVGALSLAPSNAAGQASGRTGSDGVFRYSDPGQHGKSTRRLTGHLVVAHIDFPPGKSDAEPDHAASVLTAIASGNKPMVPVTFAVKTREKLEQFGGGAVSADVVSSSSGNDVSAATVDPPPPVTSTTPMAHHAYVAVIDNSGTWVESDNANRESVVRTEVQKILDYWRTESGGQITAFSLDAYAHYLSAVSGAGPDPCGALDGSTYANFINEAAGKFPGVNLYAPGNHLILIVAPNCETTPNGGIGLGSIGSPIGFNGASSIRNFDVVNFSLSWRDETGTHELGHNFGLRHSFWLEPNNGYVLEYGDQYSPMGFGHYGDGSTEWTPPRLSQGHRAMLGVQLPGEVSEVSEPEIAPGVDVTLNPRGDAAGSREAIEVPVQNCPYNTAHLNSNHCTAWLEYRDGSGFDHGSWYGLGTQLRHPFGVTATLTYSDSQKTFLVASGYWADKAAGSYAAGSTINLGSVTATVTKLGATAQVHVGPTLPAIDPAPDPTISGTPAVGQTLTAQTTGWDAGVSFTYQWKRNGTAIPGATASTYPLVNDDHGANITVTVLGTKSGYAPTKATSAATGPVAYPDINPAPIPSIAGTPQAGEVLTATTDGWDTGVAFTYQWKRNGTAISGATSPTYTLKAADQATTITVTVVGTKAGFESTSRTANGTGPVVPVYCGGRKATIVGTAAGESVNGTASADVIVALGGNDSISGNGGNDTICGGPGNDYAKGGDGNDTFWGGTGADKFAGGAGVDTMRYSDATAGVKVTLDNVANDGNSTDGPSTARDNIRTDVENIYGTNYKDAITGDSYANVLHGGSGDDRLTGGTGADKVYGDAGSDRLYEKDGSTDSVISGGLGTDAGTRDAGDPAFSSVP